MKVEVVYPLVNEQIIFTIDIPRGSTVEFAIKHSDVLSRYPDIDLNKNKIGLFSKLVRLTDEVHEGDRIEIYRPLIIDPKTARRKRAQKA